MPTTLQAMLSVHEPLVVNIIGHFAGAVVFGIFLALLIQDRAGGRFRSKWLLIASAALALAWNLGSLAVLLLSDSSVASSKVIAALSFSFLSLLPAVLLHLSLQSSGRLVVVAGYSLSGVAVGMHLCETVRPDLDLHRAALLLVTGGFAFLTVASVIRVLLRGEEGTRGRTSRIAASMCLLLFAISFAHFESGHAPLPWSKELILHHAGIPLALYILLQDYRFVLVDALLRFLANVMLAALITLVAFEIVLRFRPAAKLESADPVFGVIAVAGSVFLLISFAFLRGYVEQWLTKVIFRRGDLDGLIRTMRAQATVIPSESEFLPWAAAEVAKFAGAEKFDLVDGASAEPIAELELAAPALAGEMAPVRSAAAWDWVEVVVPIRISQRDVRYLLLGRRRGGRRYLSEDLTGFGRLAALMAEEIERFRTSEMQRLVSQAELRALHAQINPHFLFNALNTLYGIIPKNAVGARKTVQNLADIFRYFLHSDKTLIPLSEELKIVRAYLEIERLRLGPRLETEIDVDDALLGVLIPVLSLQPLVENAVKHGISPNPQGGWLKIRAKLAGQGAVISVEDSGSGTAAGPKRGAGVGLANVTRRLQLCYGPQADVVIRSDASGTTAQFSVAVPGRIG